MPRKERNSAAPFVPERKSLRSMRRAAANCKGCDLFRGATQTVFGEGSARAELLILGEMPGDQEDLAGRPFVGPAGELLQRALDQAGVPRGAAYISNVVKHFKFKPRGKRRIHQKPNALEIQACSPWLEAELAIVKPQVILCLGATAAQALLGKSYRLTKNRGRFVSHESGAEVLATLHPAALLRMPGKAAREHAFDELVAELKSIKKRIASSA